MFWSRKKPSSPRKFMLVVHCPEHQAAALFSRKEVIGEKTFIICSHEYNDRGVSRTHEIRLPQSK